MKINSLHELFLQELRDLYSAESQIIKALPKMIGVASDDKLKEALENHLEETKEQRNRLDTIGEEFDFKVEGHECQAMKGILKEGDETVGEVADPATRDAAIIISCQRVEHYEMAAYGSAKEFAKQMGHDTAADLLNQTLDEEGNANKKLTSIAEGGLFTEGVNEQAMDE